MNKAYIKTYGCQMNVYDTQKMIEELEQDSFEIVLSPSEADLIILNTCHIREKAAEKVYSELGVLKKLKKKKQEEGGRLIIGITGCVAQAEGQEVMRRAPIVDFILGPQMYHKTRQAITQVLNSNEKVVYLDFPSESKFDFFQKKPPIKHIKVSEFVTIQEGCDKFCTFCVVPYTRGAEISRPVCDIKDEVKYLTDHGAIEIVLLGQNVNAYHGHDEGGRLCSLSDLIEQLACITALKRIRYTTSHPKDMTHDLLHAHGTIAKLVPYLHLPVQSGSNVVLKKMNRKHTYEYYIEIINSLRKERPDIALSSDFIVGFPCESDDDFEQTLNLVRHIDYAQSYSFKYSPRPGTPGAEYEQVPENIKSSRLQILQKLLKEQQYEFNVQWKDKIAEVLLEKQLSQTSWIGRSAHFQSVRVHTNVDNGGLCKVLINNATPDGLIGHSV